MQLTVQLDDWVIARPEDAVSGWVPSMQRALDPRQFARAANAEQADGGNLLVSFTFRVSRQHQDYAAAAAWLDDSPRACARTSGIFTKTGGVGAPLVTLEKAFVVTFQAEPVTGVRTNITYTVTGTLPAEIR